MEERETSDSAKGGEQENKMGKVVLFTTSIILGIAGLFPIGICRLAFDSGLVDLFSRLGSFGTVFGIGTLIAVLVFGLSKVPNAVVFGWLLLLLALLNLGGCAVMMSGLKGVH